MGRWLADIVVCAKDENAVTWHCVLSLEELAPGAAKEIVAEGRMVALFNVDGEIYALDGVCPHQGGPLGQGCLEGTVVTCPWHGWQFDVRTGQHQLNPTLVHPRLEVRIEGNQIYVALDE